MKLTKEHIGKKMKLSGWSDGCFFIPLSQTSFGLWLGETDGGGWGSHPASLEGWQFFEEPEEEIKLWSVWENPEVGDLLFITKIEAEWFDYFFPDGFVARTNKISEIEFNFLKIYKPRPDLEVVAPSILEFPNEGLRLSSEYINVEKFLKGKDMYIPFNHFKWPASLALCQIVEKKK